jgi:transposase
MPYRAYSREQDWLLPPTLGELIPQDHAVRFVAEFVDGLDWATIGIQVEPAALGAPAYAPQVLLAAWLYGFMTRTRSSRRLERACRENLPLMWLTGLQRPDHSTLARFYQANRPAMRSLFKATVTLAVAVGLVDFAFQAVDGTRLAAAAGRSMHSREQLEQLLQAVDTELAAMDVSQAQEARQAETPPSPRARLGRETVRDHLQTALSEITQRAEQPGGRQDVDAASSSDPEARLIKAPRGYVVGYNAQAVVDGKAQIVVAAAACACSSDSEQLLPMLAEAQAMTGRAGQVVAADSGYFAMDDILQAQQAGRAVFVPQPCAKKPAATAEPAQDYSKAAFVYEPETDTYRCPAGQPLLFVHATHLEHGKPCEARVYRCEHCGDCPAHASGACTRSVRGRSIKRYAHDAHLPAYQEQLRSERGRQMRRKRLHVVEPVFAATKERLGMVRFLLRGLLNAKAEWHLTCAVHNLVQLWRHWWRCGRKLAAT